MDDSVKMAGARESGRKSTCQREVEGLGVRSHSVKPRGTGLTMVNDKGMGTRAMQDLLESAASYIDYIKFGWGTGILSANLEAKIELLREWQTGFFFGGTLLEGFLLQDRLDGFRRLVDKYEPDMIELSEGTVRFKPGKRDELLRQLARDYRVVSEVGRKDPFEVMTSSAWVEMIRSDLDAGAWKVICESREGGTSGIFAPDGSLRRDLVEEIIQQLPAERIVFEAPTKQAQLWLMERLGANVNLANIVSTDVIPLESLRLGLRGDTLLQGGHRSPSEWLS